MRWLSWLLLGWLSRAEFDSTTAADCLKFLAIGDWGTSLVKSTAKAMGNYVETKTLLGCNQPVSTVLMLGDNFYENGISSTSDPKIENIFVNNFETAQFENVSFSVVAGNHGKRDFFIIIAREINNNNNNIN